MKGEKQFYKEPSHPSNDWRNFQNLFGQIDWNSVKPNIKQDKRLSFVTFNICFQSCFLPESTCRTFFDIHSITISPLWLSDARILALQWSQTTIHLESRLPSFQCRTPVFFVCFLRGNFLKFSSELVRKTFCLWR